MKLSPSVISALAGLSLSVGLFVYALWPDSQPPEIINLAPDPACDLRAGPCETQLLHDASVTFAIEPRHIPLMQTLTLEVRVSGMQVRQVVVDVNGVDMDMGVNRVTMHAAGKGRFSGNTDLSFCVRNAMQWQAVVELDAGKRIFKAPYRFITVKDASVVQ